MDMNEYRAERIKMVNKSRVRHGMEPLPEDHPVFGGTAPVLPEPTNKRQGEFTADGEIGGDA